jgi:hypothetical protein
VKRASAIASWIIQENSFSVSDAVGRSVSVENFSSAPKLVKSVNSPTSSSKFFSQHRMAFGKFVSVKLVYVKIENFW